MSSVAKHAISATGGCWKENGPRYCAWQLRQSLVSIRHAQIVAGGATVRIVAVCTTHLPSRSGWWKDRPIWPRTVGGTSDKHHFPASEAASSLRLPEPSSTRCSRGPQFITSVVTRRLASVLESPFRLVAVNLMAIYAANFVGSMRPCHRVANFSSRACNSGRRRYLPRRNDGERDDLGNVAAALHVQAAGTVALLAFDALLGMKRTPKILSDVGMTRSACFGHIGVAPGNLHVLRIRGDCVFGSWRLLDGRQRTTTGSKKYGSEEPGIRPH